MKTSRVSAIVLALSALASGYAVAAEQGGRTDAFPQTGSGVVSTKTRAEVLAELSEAQRTGDIVANVGNASADKKLNELYPSRYPAKATVQGKSRAEVVAELTQAQRNGEIVPATGGGHAIQ